MNLIIKLSEVYKKRWTISRVQGSKDKREYVVFIIDRQTHGKKQLVSLVVISR